MKSTSISKKDWKRPKTDVWFPTQTCPTTIANSANFEQDLYIMIKNTEFKFVSKNFQRQINDYIKTINSSDKVFVSADKSQNIYKIDKDQYAILLNENITTNFPLDLGLLFALLWSADFWQIALGSFSISNLFFVYF